MSLLGYSPRIMRQKTGDSPNRRDPNSASVSRPIPKDLKQNFRNLGFTLTVVALSHLINPAVFNPHFFFLNAGASVSSGLNQRKGELFLMEEARNYVRDTHRFERKVKEVATDLHVPPEWLMAVMFSESRFDAAAENLKGSGATGLIQFMPNTALDLNTSVSDLRRMDHVEQLDYVYSYLNRVRRKHGDFKTITQLYLAILFPKAIPEEVCYTLYAAPSQAYRQNAGLDEDKDGRVTVYDIDRRLLRMFPEAYQARLVKS